MIYLLKAKSETLSKFKEFKSLVENQMGKHICVLRSNNVGEFNSHAFNDLCSNAGTCRQLTIPYNPHQNGIVKRKNRTICEVAKSMMHDQDLSTSLWAKSTSTFVYIHNRIPHVVLE